MLEVAAALSVVLCFN